MPKDPISLDSPPSQVELEIVRRGFAHFVCLFELALFKMTHSRLIFATAFLLYCVCAQDPNGDLNSAHKMKCYNDRSEPIRCVPEFVNAAYRRKLVSSNTCGTPPSKYCVQTLSTGQRKECQICDNRYEETRHIPYYITDVKDDKNYSWWQSDTLYAFIRNGIYDKRTRLSRVVLTLDLGKTFEIVSIRLRFRSLRPESMAIFKQTTSDKDGPWIPYQYYSRACESFYNIEPDGLIVGSDDLQTALCTAKYSQLVPIFGGEVLFRTLANRPGRREIERLPQLQHWIRAHSLKFQLDRLNTFGDDIFGDPNVLRSYYYAIIDLTVVGKCHCNGHASECKSKGIGKNYVCQCQHNTTGVDCERCLPTHNNKPWGIATSTNAHACEACECNGLAETCEFDERLYQLTGKGGRCIDCRNNTGGPHCDRCRENYHRETEKHECKACNCNPIGSNTLQCHIDGRCYCKPGVTGDKCDRCRPNYYGFSEDGCSPCECSVLGTRPDNFQCDENGQCTCKRNVVGKNCDRCLDGHFALEADNPDGCRQCFCYGHSSDCKSAGGFSSINLTSVFRFGAEEWRALNSKGEDVTRDLATWNPGEQSLGVTSINQDSLYLTAPVSYLNMKRSSYSRILSFRFKVADIANMQFTKEDIMLVSRSKDGLKISTSLTGQGNPVPTRQFQLYQYRLHENPSFDWEPRLNAFDFQRLLNHLDEIKIRMTYSDQGTGIIDDISLEYATRDENSVDFVNWVEECTCPPPYVGLSCEACREGHKHETVNGSSYDRCVGCECNNHADQCDPDTGHCLCRDNTVGPDCSRCKDGYYGNPTAGTKDDCKPCPCVFGNQCILIGSKVKCTDCPEGHQGDLCDSCIDGFFGDPSGSRGPKTACKKCNCNGNIDTNAVQNCNSETGDCLKCIYNTRNGPKNQCELCKVGYYGDATSYPKPGCKPCDCHENGTYVSSLTPRDTPLPCDQNGQCICRPNVFGLKCDMCVENHWNINSGNGCETCNCHSTGAYNDSCDMHSGQCVCKPGVGGRECDQCLPDHYRFSPDGCRACACNTDGSLGVSCDENGRCNCRPGVLGEKCDQCGENRFNLSAGCTRCPPCYDELQIKVNKLRAILKALNESKGNNASSGNTDENPDEEFLKRLNSVKEQLHILLSKAEDTSVNDKELMKRLDAVNQTLTLIETKLENAEVKRTEASKNAKNASGEINLAEESIVRSWKLVKKIRSSDDIINKIYILLANWTKTTRRINETVREIKNLSYAQLNEVRELKRKANEALNNSQSANNRMNDVLKQQEASESQITIIDNTINDMKSLGDQAATNATAAFNLADNTLNNAQQLLDEAAIPLDDVGANETKARADDTTEEAKDVQAEAKRLAEEAKRGQANLDTKEVKIRTERLYDAENATNDLLEQAKKANETAHYAIINGTKAIALAEKNLKILENFTKIVNESRRKAEKAKENLPEIRRLIASANNNTDLANDEIGDAKNDVKDAKDIANRGTQTSSATEGDAESLKNRADSLVVPDAKVYDDVKDAEKKFKNYEDQADKNARVVKNATKMANESKTVAKSVMEAIKEVNYEIVALDSMIADIENLNFTQLEEIEKRIEVQKAKESELEASVKVVRNKKLEIDARIKSFYIDLSELEENLVELTKNHEKLHTTCLRKKSTPN